MKHTQFTHQNQQEKLGAFRRVGNPLAIAETPTQKNMCIERIAKSVLKVEIGRLQYEVDALNKAMSKAGIPSDASLDNMKRGIDSAAVSLREAGIALHRVDEKFTDAFDRVSISG
jgi:hypothetical protein